MRSSAARNEGAAPLGKVVSAVADEHRRAVLRVLDCPDTGAEPMDLDTLVERVTRVIDRNGRSAEEHRYRTRLLLRQQHLPKLDACGLIRHDTDRKQVRSVTDDLSRELLAVIESYET